MSQVEMVIRQSNSDLGGEVLELGGTELMIRGLAYVRTIEDVQITAIGVDGTTGQPDSA